MICANLRYTSVSFSRNALDPNVAGTQTRIPVRLSRTHIFFFAARMRPLCTISSLFDADCLCSVRNPGLPHQVESSASRCSRGPFVAEGYLANLDFPEMFVTVEGSPEPQLLPGRSSTFVSGALEHTGGMEETSPGVRNLSHRELLLTILQDHAGGLRVRGAQLRLQGQAISPRCANRESRIEQYLGDDPRHGIPGLYWMNIFGPLYADWFGTDRIAAASRFAGTTYLPDGSVYLRFGDRAEASETRGPSVNGSDVRYRRWQTMRFFDIERPRSSFSTFLLLCGRNDVCSHPSLSLLSRTDGQCISCAPRRLSFPLDWGNGAAKTQRTPQWGVAARVSPMMIHLEEQRRREDRAAAKGGKGLRKAKGGAGGPG